MFIDMLNHANFAQYDLSSLKTGIMAGSPCPVEVMKQVIDKMHMKEVTVSIYEELLGCFGGFLFYPSNCS